MSKLAYLACRQESGATMVEYGLMVAAIAALIVGIVFLLGNTVNNQFTAVNGNITAKK